MKLVCFLFVSIALFSVSHGMLVTQAGGNTTSTWSYPTFSTSGTCSPSTAGSYSSFLLNATSGAGIYRISIITDYDLDGDSIVFVYSNFSASSPCSNLVVNRVLSKEFSLSGGPTFDDFVYLPQAGWYTVVISGTNQEFGLWSAYVYKADFNSSTNTGSNWHLLDNGIGQENTCGAFTGTSSDTSQYQAHTFTSSMPTGVYDMVIGFVNETYRASSVGNDWDSYAVVFSGSWPPSSSSGTLSPCTTGSSFTYLSGSEEDYYGVMLVNITLTKSSTYTLVVSGGNQQTGMFGIFFLPTLYRDLASISSPTWYPPDIGSSYSNCVTQTSYQHPYIVNSFTPSVNSVFLSRSSNTFFSSSGAESALRSFLYRSNFTTTAPTTCNDFISSGGGYGDLLDAALAVEVSGGKTYTVLGSLDGSSGTKVNGQYLWFAYLGPESSSTTSSSSSSTTVSTTSTPVSSSSSTVSTTSTPVSSSSSTVSTTSTPVSSSSTTVSTTSTPVSSSSSTVSTTSTPVSSSTTSGASSIAISLGIVFLGAIVALYF